MTPESAAAVEPEPAGMGEFSRLSGVFFEPGKAFADIAERPRWLVPLLLIIVATVAFYVVYGQHIGWQTFVQDMMDNNARMQQQMQSLSPEQRAQSLAVQQKIYPIMYYVGPVFGLPLMYIVSSAILLGIASGMMSAGVRFKQIFAIECYAGLVGIVSKLLGIVVMFLKNPDQFNLMNPLAFNPGAFMDQKRACGQGVRKPFVGRDQRKTGSHRQRDIDGVVNRAIESRRDGECLAQQRPGGQRWEVPLLGFPKRLPSRTQ